MRPRQQQTREYHPAVMMITNIRENGEPIGAIPDGEMMFHTDTSYDANPHDGTSLFAMQVIRDGGHTLFSNQYMVYDALPDSIRTRLAGRQAMHVFEFGTTVKTKKRYDRETSPATLVKPMLPCISLVSLWVMVRPMPLPPTARERDLSTR